MAFMVYVYAAGTDPEVDEPVEVHGPIASDYGVSLLSARIKETEREAGSMPSSLRVEEVIVR